MVQTYVLLMEPLPALNHVYSMVLQDNKFAPKSSFTANSKILVNASTPTKPSWKGNTSSRYKH